MRRVAITGLGVISALGNNQNEFWKGLAEGRSGIAPVQAVDMSGFRFHNGAEVRGYDPVEHFPGGTNESLDRFAQFAVIAAREAVASSGLPLTPESSARTAVILGAAIGGQCSQETGFQELYVRNRTRVHPLTIPKAMMNAGTSHVCMDLGITGPAMTISTACSSANHAIGQAFWMVRSGQVDQAITGGSEAPFSFGLLKAWEAMRVVSPDTCRPFSKDRAGLILGEGGAILVLEAYDLAVERGAVIVGEIVGFGMSADAHHITQPTIAGPAEAMRGALADAGVPPSSIGYINAHGTGTVANDATETQAIRAVFGAHADELLVSSTKSMHGHALGAAGAIEAIATILALHHGVIPPTINFTEPDPACNLNVVVDHARPAKVDHALSNSFAFGGLNAVLMFRSPQAASSVSVD